MNLDLELQFRPENTNATYFVLCKGEMETPKRPLPVVNFVKSDQRKGNLGLKSRYPIVEISASKVSICNCRLKNIYIYIFDKFAHKKTTLNGF